MHFEHLIKFVPEDFVVREVLIPSSALDPSGEKHSYYLLRKNGVTTFQAVRRLADAMNIDPMSISYAGLKDEDGVTEQHVGIAASLSDAEIQQFNARFVGEQSTLTLISLDKSGPPIRVGHLIGNAFRIIIRRLSGEQVESMLSRPSTEFVFINYYDTQRFGVPNGPKTTHLIGASLFNGKFDEALSLLSASGAEEADLAKNWRGLAQNFFAQLDPRIVHFYYAAFASYQWNTELMASIADAGRDVVVECERPPLKYLFTTDERLLKRIHEAALAKPLRRFSRGPGFPETKPEVRPGRIQTRVRIIDHGADEYHDGRQKVAVELFLSSGCYATMALEQFVTEHTMGAGCSRK